MLEFGYFHFPMYWFVIDRQYCCPLHHHCHKIQDDCYSKKDQQYSNLLHYDLFQMHASK